MTSHFYHVSISRYKNYYVNMFLNIGILLQKAIYKTQYITKINIYVL